MLPNIIIVVFPTANYFSEELLESENNRRVESVANKVSTLKHVSIN